MSDPKQTQAAPAYGSREWLDQQYERSGSDPWGLDWRPSQAARYHHMLDALRASLRRRGAAPGSALDIGCATGTFTAMLAGALANGENRVVGIDATELAVERARVRYPFIDFQCPSIDEAAQRFDAEFDLITMLEVLYYVPDAERAQVLQKVRKMLKPGGTLLVSSMIAKQPYMSAEQLRTLVSASFSVIDSGVLYLKPLTLIEKPLLRIVPAVERWRRAPFRPVPTRPRAADRLARIAENLLGARALSHSYVIAVRDSETPA
jgi:2-polyprenyl-3-methyl-5-hydroxy-6-metoxy-1,4-benzoquinol methylase